MRKLPQVGGGAGGGRCGLAKLIAFQAFSLTMWRAGARSWGLLHGPPARVGQRLHEVQTPALVVDADALDSNVANMAGTLRPSGVALRPHAKAHKCPALALKQIAAGAVGVCAQQAAEAEALVRGGVKDVFVSNQVVDPVACDRLASASASGARIAVAVDSVIGVERLAAAARRRNTTIDAIVEVDVGQARCGVPSDPPNAAVPLAGTVAAASPYLRLSGIQAYHGWNQLANARVDRQKVSADTAAAAARVVGALRSAGLVGSNGAAASRLDDDLGFVVTGGGTGSAVDDAATGVFTEVQPGSYALMDVAYASLQDAVPAGLRHALFVMGTVISDGGGIGGGSGVPPSMSRRAVVDAGLKAMAVDLGPPHIHTILCGMSGKIKARDLTVGGVQDPLVTNVKISDEHFQFNYGGGVEGGDSGRSRGDELLGGGLHIGDKCLMVPGHVDPTCNLHYWFVVVSNNVVIDLWPISAKGYDFNVARYPSETISSSSATTPSTTVTDDSSAISFSVPAPPADWAERAAWTFAMHDSDGDGRLSLHEFCALVGEVGTVLPPSEVTSLFSAYDANGDGFISMDEFRAALDAESTAPKG